MEKLLVFLLIGMGAQLVDGSLGMGFGMTSTTLLVYSGVGAASASAVVHLVEVGTTCASGVSHWKMGNVDWKMALALGIPGSVGAFLGAVFLGHVADSARPVTSAVLIGLGIFIILRFAGFFQSRGQWVWGARSLGLLGFVGGTLDATGGGGWGPTTTSVIMAAERGEPRKILGTALAAEFLVTVAATIGFIPVLIRVVEANMLAALGLLLGGVVIAPVAAWLSGKVKGRFLGGAIGVLLLALNIGSLLTHLGVAAAVWWQLAVLVVGLILVGWLTSRQQDIAPTAAPAPAEKDVETVAAKV